MKERVDSSLYGKVLLSVLVGDETHYSICQWLRESLPGQVPRRHNLHVLGTRTEHAFRLAIFVHSRS